MDLRAGACLPSRRSVIPLVVDSVATGRDGIPAGIPRNILNHSPPLPDRISHSFHGCRRRLQETFGHCCKRQFAHAASGTHHVCDGWTAHSRTISRSEPSPVNIATPVQYWHQMLIDGMLFPWGWLRRFPEWIARKSPPRFNKSSWGLLTLTCTDAPLHPKHTHPQSVHWG